MYDYSLDIWSYGAMLSGMVFRKDPFFNGRDNTDQLVVITKTLGSAALSAYLKKYNLSLSKEFDGVMKKYRYQ